MSETLKLAIAGAGGRMGRTLVAEASRDPALAVASAFDVAGSPAIGRDAGPVRVSADAAGAIAAAEVLIDFTRPEGTMAHLAHCERLGRAIVIGTTGIDPAGRARIAAASAKLPVVMAANFALGVNAFYALAERAARILGDDYDVEIVEAHHRHKVDAPSGTALRAGEIVAAALGRTLGEVAKHGREGVTGERDRRTIGFHAIRGGDIVGEHTVIFAGEGERVEVTVRSSSRSTYAAGALRAAKWLRGRPPGLYDMADVLGMKAG